MLRIVTILLLLAGIPIMAAPLVMYDGQNLTGSSGEITKTYTIYTTSGSNTIPNSLNNKVSSFVLAQG